MFKIKNGYKLDLQTPETTNLFASIKKLINKTKNAEKVLFEVFLVQHNLLDNQYQ